MRRLKVLVDMPAEDRPISIYRLEKLAKLYPRYIYVMVNHHERLCGKVARRLGRVLEAVENGQVVVEAQPKVDGKVKNMFGTQTVRIVDKKNPPQKMARRIVFTAKGPKVVNVVFNPNALQKG
jgi:hypothetical protein